MQVYSAIFFSIFRTITKQPDVVAPQNGTTTFQGSPESDDSIVSSTLERPLTNIVDVIPVPGAGEPLLPSHIVEIGDHGALQLAELLGIEGDRAACRIESETGDALGMGLHQPGNRLHAEHGHRGENQGRLAIEKVGGKTFSHRGPARRRIFPVGGCVVLGHFCILLFAKSKFA